MDRIESARIDKLKVRYLRTNTIRFCVLHLLVATLICATALTLTASNRVFQWLLVLALLVCLYVVMVLRQQQSTEAGTDVSSNTALVTILSGLIGVMHSLAISYLIFRSDSVVTLVYLSVIFMISLLPSMYLLALRRYAIAYSIAMLVPVVVSLLLRQELVMFVTSALLLILVSAFVYTSVSMSHAINQMIYMKLRLLDRRARIWQLQKDLRNKSIQDSECSVFNRQYMEYILNNEVRRAKRENTNLSFIIVGIDWFDDYATRYGETMAVQSMNTIARIIKSCVNRGGEIVTRFDTNQFGIILPSVSDEDAQHLIAIIKHAIASANIPNLSAGAVGREPLSISVGLSGYYIGKPLERREIINCAISALTAAMAKPIA